MANLNYSPNAQMNVPVLSKELTFGSADDDGLSPTDTDNESGISAYFNAQGGLYVGPHNDIGGYAGIGWERHISETPEAGHDGTRSDLSFAGVAGVKSGLGTDGPVGFVQGGFSYMQGQAEWNPPETGSYEDDIYNDEGEIVGVETITYEDPGYHSYGQDSTLFVASGSAYADTSGFAGIDANMGLIHSNGEGTTIQEGIYVGYNTDDGASACLHGSAAHALNDNWSAYGSAEICVGHEESDVEIGVRGNLSLGGGGSFSQVPVSLGVGMDESSSGPEVRATVIGFEF